MLIVIKIDNLISYQSVYFHGGLVHRYYGIMLCWLSFHVESCTTFISITINLSPKPNVLDS